MDGRHVIGLLQAVADEGVGVLDAVHKVGAPLDHTLIDELLERFVLGADADVMEEFVPESGVDEVAGGVLRAAEIEVYILPIVHRLLAHQSL